MTARDGSAGRPRIVDFSSHISGPLASSLLREFGADVVKIEPPGHGDGLRDLHRDIAGHGQYHAALNHGARSLSISAKSPHWPAVVAACARWADAFIVGGRPHVLRRRGLDFMELKKIAPQLVYCAISGYGDSGPWAKLAAHGLNTDAFAGVVPVSVQGDRPVVRPGYFSAGTPLAGVFAAMGILGALYRRSLGHPAEYVSVSLWGSAMWWNWRAMNMFANAGRNRTDYQNLGSRYAAYLTADERTLLICPTEEAFWKRFCQVVELPEGWESKGDWSRHTCYGDDSERPVIAAALKKQPMQHWIEAFTAADIPFAPVLTTEEAMNSEHARVNHVMRPVDAGTQQVPITVSPIRRAPSAEEEGEPWVAPKLPALGEHTAEVLEELGLAHLAAEIAPPMRPAAR